MILRAHGVGVEELDERKAHERHGHRLSVSFRHAAIYGEAAYAEGCHDKPRLDDALEDDVHARPAREEAGIGLSRRLLHDVFLRLFHAERERGKAVRDEVDPKDHERGEEGGAPDDRRDEQAQHLRDVGGEQELDCLLDVGEDLSALFHRADDGGEVVVREHEIRRALADVRARDAHADADVRALDGGRVVDAVARHGDHLALALIGGDDPHLVLGADAREDGILLDGGGKLLVTHLVQIRAEDDLVPFAQDADVGGDGGRGVDVVARDHDGTHARADADSDRLLHFRSGRVDHAHQTHEGETVLQLAVLKRAVLHRDAEDAERLLRHTGVRLLDLLDVLFGHGTDFFAHHHFGAAREEHVGRALDVRLFHAVVLVDGGHELAHAVEGDFVHAGIFRGESVIVIAAVLRIGDERGLGGIAAETFRGLFRVVAKRHRAQESLEIFPVGSAVFVHGSETAIRKIIAFYGHLIEG